MSRSASKVTPETIGKRSLYRPSFDELLKDTIKDTLRDVFGNSSTTTIIKTMERVHSLRFEETPEKSELFDVALQSILGTGHQIIEDMILENLSLKLGQRHEYEKDCTFADYINKLRSCDYQRRT